MASEKLNMGAQYTQFEAQFADWQGTKCALIVNSGNSANSLLVEAMLNYGKRARGGKICVPDITLSTNVMQI